MQSENERHWQYMPTATNYMHLARFVKLQRKRPLSAAAAANAQMATVKMHYNQLSPGAIVGKMMSTAEAPRDLKCAAHRKKNQQPASAQQNLYSNHITKRTCAHHQRRTTHKITLYNCTHNDFCFDTFFVLCVCVFWCCFFFHALPSVCSFIRVR